MRFSVPQLGALVLVLAVAGGASAQEPQKWAVVVGVNDYVHFGDEPGGDLRGAERDARSFHEVLVERWGFPEENTRLLLSGDATRSAIREAITEWAGSRVGSDDALVFYFAGHGAQALDGDGDEADDGLDETLAPADALPNGSDNDILDDELREWLQGLGVADVVVILDSCHSGSATRATGPMRARVLGRPPPRGNVSTRALNDGAPPPPERMAEGEARILEIAAAAPHQSAMEGVFQNSGSTSTFPAGAFTFYLVRQLWQAPPRASYQALFRRVLTDLKAGHFTQDPQVSGPVETPIFATRATPSVADDPKVAAAAPAPAATGALEVLQAGESAAVLAGGTVKAVTVGSLYGTPSGSVLRVTDVRQDEATANVVQGSPRVGEAATLLDVALPIPELAVGVSHLSSELAGAVRTRVDNEPDMEIVSDADAPADLFLRPSEDNLAIQVLGRDGGVRSTALATGTMEATAERLLATLRKELAIKRLANLENPGAPFGVELEVGGGQRVFHQGDTISFRVRSDLSGYLTLIDLGMDGTVTILHPNGFEDLGRLTPGQEVQVPGDWAVFTVGEETGLGLVRAIVTPEPLRIPGASRDMRQDRDGAGLADEIRELLKDQTRDLLSQQRDVGPGGTGPAGAPPASRWATTMVVYEVRSN